MKASRASSRGRKAESANPAGSAVVIFGIKLADSAGAPLAVTALLIVTVLLSSAAAGTITGLTLLRLLRQSAAPIPTRVGA